MRRRRKNSLWVLFIFLLIVFIGIELYLPSIANRRLREIFEQETESIEELEINIASFPALKILTGRVDHVSVRSRGLMFDGLYLEQFNLNYQDIIIHRGGFVGVNSYLEAIISEEALNNYLNSKYPEMGSFLLEINSEQIILQGEVKLFEVEFDFQLSGNLVLNDKNQIYFVPDDLRVQDINIPANLLKAYIEEYTFRIDLQTLEIPIEIDQIEVYSDYIIIYGGEER